VQDVSISLRNTLYYISNNCVKLLNFEFLIGIERTTLMSKMAAFCGGGT